jgi:CBS domain-containing protein
MKNVRDLLQDKGDKVFTVSPNATVYEALQLMAEKNLGALVVCDREAVVGLLSERDYARKIALKGLMSKDVPVSAIMTSNVIHVTPDHNIESCMSLMNNHRIRHLPVIENGRLVGLVSIGDIVKAIIHHHKDIIAQLEGYIKGSL